LEISAYQTILRRMPPATLNLRSAVTSADTI